MMDFFNNGLIWPLWPHIKMEAGQLWGRTDRPPGKNGAWEEKTRDLAKEPALALELARVNRARRSAKDPAHPAERARALLAFTANAGPLGQQTMPQHHPGVWCSLEELSWALAHAAALDFMLTLGGLFSAERRLSWSGSSAA